MQYLITPRANVARFEPFVWWEGAFHEDELNWLQAKAAAAEDSAKVSDNKEVYNIRRSKVSWLDNTPNTEWVFEKLGLIAAKLNAQYYQFDLTGFGEPLQLTHYDQSENGMYGWHQDFGVHISRKLSLVLQLSDPSDYEGGNLQVMNTGDPKNIRKQRGLVAVFPSYALHQVTPVTQGSRQSLVAWVSGSPFR